MKKSSHTLVAPAKQADAVLNQANPVSGTLYTVLDTTRNARIYSIVFNCTWTDQPTPLELHVTIDGQTEHFSFVNPVSATWYCVDPQASVHVNTDRQLSTSSTGCAFVFEARSIKIEVEITGGTVSNLSARVKYAKW